jgi:hypothetical protein
LGHEADHSLPSSAEIKNGGAIPPHPLTSSLQGAYSYFSLARIVSEPALWRLVTFRGAHLMSTCFACIVQKNVSSSAKFCDKLPFQ